MNKKNIISTIFGVLFFISLIITIVYGIHLGLSNNKIKKEQGIYTTVEIQKVNDSYYHYKKDNSKRKYDYTVYDCDISFTYNGEQFSQESASFTNRNKFLHEGDTIKLYIDKNTKQVLKVSDYTGNIRYKLLGLISISIILFLISAKTNPRNNRN